MSKKVTEDAADRQAVRAIANELKPIFNRIYWPVFCVSESWSPAGCRPDVFESSCTFEIRNQTYSDWCHASIRNIDVCLSRMVVFADRIYFPDPRQHHKSPLMHKILLCAPNSFAEAIRLFHKNATEYLEHLITKMEVMDITAAISFWISRCVEALRFVDLKYIVQMHTNEYLWNVDIPDILSVGGRIYHKKEILAEMHDPCEWVRDVPG